MGPSARESAPIERNIPSIVPFWSGGPNVETRVDKVGTTVAEEYAYKMSPADITEIVDEKPTSKKEGTTAAIPFKIKRY